jgi:hypothetical protein
MVSMPPELKARPFTADEQCSLNQAMKALYTATATALDKTAPFNVKRVGSTLWGLGLGAATALSACILAAVGCRGWLLGMDDSNSYSTRQDCTLQRQEGAF